MKTSSIFLTGLILAFTLFACNTSQSGKQEKEEEQTETSDRPVGDNSRVSLDWDGVYTGTLPCADCEGIKTVIRLKKDETYVMQTQYLGKSDEIFTQTGSFEWGPNGGRITLAGLDDSVPARYLVGENRLFHLDRDGKRITGDLEDKYQLVKQRAGLANTRWKLVEIMGKNVANMDLMKEPYITLTTEAEGWKVAGNDGCNNLVGSYDMGDHGTIAFKPLASTSMACPKPDLGQEISQAMEKVSNYSISKDGTRLSLSEGDAAPLAVFEADFMGGN